MESTAPSPGSTDLSMIIRNASVMCLVNTVRPLPLSLPPTLILRRLITLELGWTKVIEKLQDLKATKAQSEQNSDAAAACISSPQDIVNENLKPRTRLDEFPLRFQIQGKRVFISTIVVTTFLLAAVLTIDRGLTFNSVDITHMDAASQKQLQDRYNSWFGVIMSALSMPLHYLTSMLVPVFFLCFMRLNALQHNKGLVDRWIVALTTSLLIGQGSTSISIQFAQSMDIVIRDSDLVAADSGVPQDIMANPTRSSPDTGNPSTNTILRRAIRPSRDIMETNCVGLQQSIFTNVAAKYTGNSIRYGFKLNSWLGNMLNESIEIANTSKLNMSVNIEAGSMTSSELPNGSPFSTATLFKHGLDIFSKIFDYQSPNIEINNSDTAQMLIDVQQNVLEGTWPNISTSKIGVQIAAVELSNQIRFDAITFDLPVEYTKMQQWVSEAGISEGDNRTSGFNASDLCNEQACVLRMPKTAYSDQVGVFRLCKSSAGDTNEFIRDLWTDDCSFPVDSSVLIFSVAHRILVDDVNTAQSPSGIVYLSMKNISKMYTVTVGRLSWEVEDLAKAYKVKCDSEVRCSGLRFQLDNNNQQLLLSEKATTDLVTTSKRSVWSNWEVLAISQNQIESNYEADLIYPPDYFTGEDSFNWSARFYNCSAVGSYFINDMIQGHIYSNESLQAAYTTGKFWLFGNARVLNIEGDGWQLPRFDGNRLLLKLYVSMPFVSAFMKLLGCIFVLLAGLFVSYWSGDEKEIYDAHLQLSSPHHAAGLMFNTAQYPPLLVRTEIVPEDEAITARYDIREYTITHVVLCHQENGSMRTIKASDNKPIDNAAAMA